MAAAVVIYNIFHISITRKVQEYGQLRTIGMTSKQMKQLIMREGRRIAFPSIVVGIIAGAVLGYIILPEGWNTLNFLKAALFSFVFGILTVSLSIHSPAKIASKTSPMKALRFSSYSIDKSNKRNRRYRITPLRLTILNLGRSKKRSFLTVLSLGLCGVILIKSGILLAVGLTRRQLCKTRIFEGEALVIGSILIAFLIGIPVGYLAANTFRITGAVEQYIFPFKEYSIFLVVLIVIDILLEFILNRSMKKQSLIEQMRAME